MDFNKLLDLIIKKVKGIFANANNENSIEKKKPNKAPNFLIACLTCILVCVLVVLGSDYFKSSSTVKVNKQNSPALEEQSLTTRNYEAEEENKLKATLEGIEGVGKVKVMLTMDGSEEQVPAINVNSSTSNTKETDNSGGKRDTTQENNGSTIVVTSDGSKNIPLIVKTKKPKIVGVCVVAEGAKDKVIELKIMQAIARLYNIQLDKITVFPMEK